MLKGAKTLAIQEITVEVSKSQIAPSKDRFQLSHLSAYALRGDFIALLGESGVGKTTLLRAIAGLTPVISGQISRLGVNAPTDFQDLAPEHRHIGYTAQESLLFPHLNVSDNLAQGLATIPPKRRQNAIIQALSAVELSTFTDRWPSQLSGGQQRRVALARSLARAFCGASDLLLLDEPLNSVEPRLRLRILDRLTHLCRTSKVTIIWATHQIDLAMKFVSRLWAMERPDLLHNGLPLELYDDPPSRSIATLLGELVVISPHHPIIQSSNLDIPSNSAVVEIGLRPSQWSLINTDLSHESPISSRQPSLTARGRIMHLEQARDHLLVDLLSDHATEDLPNSSVIRMKLSKSLELKVNQELQARYLGEPLVFRIDKESL